MRYTGVALMLAAGLTFACTASNTAAPVASTPAAVVATPQVTHAVALGETLALIASRYGVPLDALAAANGITNPSLINVGQQLVIPGLVPPGPAVAAAPVAPAVEAPSEPSPPPLPPRPGPDDAGYVDVSEAAALRGDVPAVAPFEIPPSRLERAVERVKTQIEAIRARSGGTVMLVVGGLVAALVAVQVLASLLHAARIGAVAIARRSRYLLHEAALTVWYGAWWVGLALWVPATRAWSHIGPRVAPPAKALSRFAVEHGTAWSKRGAAFVQAQAAKFARQVRDEGIDALEELALKRPGLRPVSERIQELAYRDDATGRARRAAPQLGVWPPAEEELLAALDQGQIQIEYQAVLDLKSQRVAALSTSLHWDRGDADVVPDGRLATAFDRPGYTRLARAALEYRLRSACSMLGEMQQTPGAPSVTVALTRAQFFDPTLFSVLRSALQASGASADQLEIAVPERAVLADLPASSEILTRLRESGVRTILDGYGSLTLDELRSLGLTSVSIDFWSSAGTGEAFVLESVRAAQAAGLTVIATRAETPQAVHLARKLSCDRLLEDAPALSPRSLAVAA